MLSRSVQTHPALDLAMWDAYNPDGRVLIADGVSIAVTVRSGQLVITDGPPADKRTRRLGRVPRTYDRILLAADHGYITVEALRWLADTATHWASISVTELLAIAPPKPSDPRLIREQATVYDTPVGRDIARRLLATKLGSQKRTVREHFQSPKSVLFIQEQINGLMSCDSLADMLGYEAMAASEYFALWVNHIEPQYKGIRRTKVPKHWLTYPGRGSYAYETVRLNRSATDPVNAMLNYIYRVAETEAVHLCHALGLHPGLGVLHADRSDRDSLALDLIETARPACDLMVLDILARPLDIRWLQELGNGVVRLQPPLTHRLLGQARTIGRVMAPYAEFVARAIGEGVRGVRVRKLRPSLRGNGD